MRAGDTRALVRTVWRYEMGIWRCLAVWLLRLRRCPAGAVAFGYAGAVLPLFLAFIAISAIELPILHLALPWETVRLVADILGAWGLVWMIGLLAAVRVHPHVVDDSGVRIRHGFTLDVTVPWSAIASARSRGRSVDGGRTVHYDQSAGVVSVGVARQTTVDLVLRSPIVLELPQTGGQPVTEVRLYADDPGGLVEAVRSRLPSTPR